MSIIQDFQKFTQPLGYFWDYFTNRKGFGDFIDGLIDNSDLAEANTEFGAKGRTRVTHALIREFASFAGKSGENVRKTFAQHLEDNNFQVYIYPPLPFDRFFDTPYVIHSDYWREWAKSAKTFYYKAQPQA